MCCRWYIHITINISLKHLWLFNPGLGLDLRDGHTPAAIPQTTWVQKSICVNISVTPASFIFLPSNCSLSYWSPSGSISEGFDLYLSHHTCEYFTWALTETCPKAFVILPQHKSSCPRLQHSAGRCFSCCPWHWHQHSHTLHGPALLQSMLGSSEDIQPDGVHLHMAVRSEVAAPPLRSRSGAPCREGAEMSHCAHYACWDFHLCLGEKTYNITQGRELELIFISSSLTLGVEGKQHISIHASLFLINKTNTGTFQDLRLTPNFPPHFKPVWWQITCSLKCNYTFSWVSINILSNSVN